MANFESQYSSVSDFGAVGSALVVERSRIVDANDLAANSGDVIVARDT
ncbi:MAG: hypothetical protein OSA42_05210 [Porticoccaceae bacterium]|nr:hypothetical protein [Porticoccaceae bacterium]